MINEILMSCLSEAGQKGTVVEQLAETGGRLSKAKTLAHRGKRLGFRSGPDERMASRMLRGRIIDLSHKLYSGQEEYGLEIETFRTQDLYPQYQTHPGDHYILTKVRITPHVGTHIEAPSHYIQGAKDVSELPLERLVGEALVMDFSHKLKDEAITLEEIQAYGDRIQPGDIVLLRTGASVHYRTPKAHDRPYVVPDAVSWLVERGISCLGTDASGIEPRGVDRQINHFILFSHDIPLIEFMNNLDQLRSERVMLFVLPWNLAGTEASPVRVIAIDPGAPEASSL